MLKMCTKLCRCLLCIALLSCTQLQSYTHHFAPLHCMHGFESWLSQRLRSCCSFVHLQTCFLAKKLYVKHFKRIHKHCQFIDKLISSIIARSNLFQQFHTVVFTFCKKLLSSIILYTCHSNISQVSVFTCHSNASQVTVFIHDTQVSLKYCFGNQA